MSADPAPIVLFAYNRPDHTLRTLEALRANRLASASDLTIFSDGPKNPDAAAKVQAVRALLRGGAQMGFRSVKVIERERNLGLARSVISGVTEVISARGEVIVLEDDIVTAPDFLEFINAGLRRYRDDPKVFSIGALNLVQKLPDSYPYEAYGGYRCCSWGWATWQDRWAKADWEVRDYPIFRRDLKAQRRFNRGGQDLSPMLRAQMMRKLDSWAIRWAYAHFKNEAYCIYPTISKVRNIGMDGSGIHCESVGEDDKRWNTGFGESGARESERYRFPGDPTPIEEIAVEYARPFILPLKSRAKIWAKNVVISLTGWSG